MIKLFALAGLSGLFACTEISSDPPIDCNSQHGHFIQLEPGPTDSFLGYRIDVGDSIRITGSVRREESSAPAFHPQQGWYCVTTSSSPVSAVVTLTSSDPQVLAIRASGWIRGLSLGTATLVASSVNPPVTISVGFHVFSP